MSKHCLLVLFSGWFWFFAVASNLQAQKYFQIDPRNEWAFSIPAIDTVCGTTILYPNLVNAIDGNYQDASFLNRPLFHSSGNNYAFKVNPIIGSEFFVSENIRTTHGFLGLAAEGHITSYLSAGIKYYAHRGAIPKFTKEKIDSVGFVPFFGSFSEYGNTYSTHHLSWYVNFQPEDFLSISAGRGNQFIGSGRRSLFLTDLVEPYPFIKTQVLFDRFQYLFQVSFLENNSTFILPAGFAKQKYTSTHFLNFNVLPNLQVGLFETVIWAPDDSTRNRGLDFNYLNPVIFLRPVEFSIGSPDNVLVGLSADLKIGSALKLYGQFLLDEYNLHYATNTHKWWGNKYGYQLGTSFSRIINVMSVSFFAEYNHVRPFTYSHYYSSKSYGHQIYPLAHPLGANFKETITGLHIKKGPFFICNTLFLQQYASDSTGSNYGNEIFMTNATRSLDFGSVMLQGIQKNVITNRFLIGYTLHPEWKASFTFEYIFRKESGIETGHTLFVGIRTGLAKHDIYDARY